MREQQVHFTEEAIQVGPRLPSNWFSVYKLVQMEAEAVWYYLQEISTRIRKPRSMTVHVLKRKQIM